MPPTKWDFLVLANDLSQIRKTREEINDQNFGANGVCYRNGTGWFDHRSDYKLVS
jgi:hypothetical protein